MVKTYALVKGGTVINVCVWDTVAQPRYQDYLDASGTVAIEVVGNVSTGDSWDGSKFAPAPPPSPTDKSELASLRVTPEKALLMLLAGTVPADVKTAALESLAKLP